jgi:hypothetical protein
MLVFGYHSHIPTYNQGFYELELMKIQDKGNRLENMWQFILGIFCQRKGLNSYLQGIYDINDLMALLQVLHGTYSAGNAVIFCSSCRLHVLWSARSSCREFRGEEVTKQLRSYSVDRLTLAVFARGHIHGCSF